jgi:phospholipase/carboxylesterase
VAGVIALNGLMPATVKRSISRRKSIHGLPVFIGHGKANPVVPLSMAQEAESVLVSAGAAVRFESYATTHRIHPDMLRDVNRWIMGAVTTEPDVMPMTSQG